MADSITILDLVSVTGGRDIDYTREPQAVVDELYRSMHTCQALEAAARKHNPAGFRQTETQASAMFREHASKCWASLSRSAQELLPQLKEREY